MAHVVDPPAAAPDVAIADPAGSPHGRLREPAQPDGHAALLRRRGGDQDVVVAIVLPLEREPLARPRVPEDLDGLHGPAEAFRGLLAPHPELLVPPPQPEPQDQPAVR